MKSIKLEVADVRRQKPCVHALKTAMCVNSVQACSTSVVVTTLFMSVVEGNAAVLEGKCDTTGRLFSPSDLQ